MITREWLEKRYVFDLANVGSIADEAGCSVHNIKRYLKKWRLLRGVVAMVGKPAWNSGLNKGSDERMAALSAQRMGSGNPMFGAIAWNSGLTKDSDDRVALVSIKLTGRAVSEETREKQSTAKLGLSGKFANNFKTGHSEANGYEVTLVTGDYEYTHRIIAEEGIGRKLAEFENVHHFDKNKLNNAPSNLIVLSATDHTRLHHNVGDKDKIEQIRWLEMGGIFFELVEKS